MAQGVCVVLNTAEREQLAAIAADRNRPRKHIERARIVLAELSPNFGDGVKDQAAAWA